MGIGLPRTVLAVPGAPAMVVWSLLGRFGFTMGSLGLLLFVSARSGSYATAGLVSACGLLGTSAGMVVQGRLIDRFGPTRPLLALAAPHAALAAAAVLGIQAGTPTAVVAVLVAAQCAALPAVTAASRTMWSRLVPAGPTRDATYGYEALSNELCWLLGPAAAGLLATLLWPGTALVAALAMATVAAVGFARTRAVRSHQDPAPAPGHRAPAADSSHRGGLAVLLVAAAGLGEAEAAGRPVPRHGQAGGRDQRQVHRPRGHRRHGDRRLRRHPGGQGDHPQRRGGDRAGRIAHGAAQRPE